jgi:hypothetical protein
MRIAGAVFCAIFPLSASIHLLGTSRSRSRAQLRRPTDGVAWSRAKPVAFLGALMTALLAALHSLS